MMLVSATVKESWSMRMIAAISTGRTGGSRCLRSLKGGNDMEDLKKCPFCGGKAEIVGYKIFWVICKECTAETKSFDTREEAIEA